MGLGRAIFVVATMLVGCNSTGVGNPPRGVVSLELVSDDHVEPESEDADAGVLPDGVVTHAVLAFGEIRWLACDDNDADVVVDGPILVDLVTHRVEPELPAVVVPPGGVCGIDAVLSPVSRPNSDVERSVVFSGVRQDGVAFVLVADMSGTLRMRPRPDVVWDFTDSPSLLWALRPRRWVESSALNDAESESINDAERVVVIDMDRHPALYEAIRSRLAGVSTLHLDLNGNGALDPEETADEAWIGTGLQSLD